MPEEFYSAIMLVFGIRVSGHKDEVENDSEDEEEDMEADLVLVRAEALVLVGHD